MAVPSAGSGQPVEATIQVYESQGTNQDQLVVHSRELDKFNSGKLPDVLGNDNHVNAYRVSLAPAGTPLDLLYIGKSTLPRGQDAGENTGTIPPVAGVLDFQVHPNIPSKPVVVAFVVPFKANYVLSDFAARQIFDKKGGDVGVYVYVQYMSNPNSASPMVTEITVKDQRWNVSKAMDMIPIGQSQLSNGDRILFAIDCKSGSCNYNATELAWTLTATP